MSIQIVLQPDALDGIDTYVMDGSYAGVNFGNTTPLGIGTAQVGKITLRVRALVRFDLGAIPQGATILDATLTLIHAPGSVISGSQQFKAYRLTRAEWTEFGATWNQYDGSSSWTAAGGDYTTEGYDSVTITSGIQDLVFDSLAGLAADAIANRDGLLHLLVIGPELGTNNNLLVHSSDSAEPVKRPKLVVNYEVPVPQLTVTDHGDDTGATATISGAAAQSDNTVYVQSFGGDLGGGAWSVGGSVEGNGDVPLDLPTGHYFAYVVSSLGEIQAVSAVHYFVVTDGLESIHTRCLAAVQARIRLLALDGLANERVVIEKLPAGRNLTSGVGLPAVILSPHRAAMPAAAGTNSLDDVHYDVLVAIFDRDNQEPTLQANLDRHLLWRQQIARAFRNQRLGGVSEVINSEVEPAEGLLDEAWKRELMTSAVVVRFTSRETRGFN
ncbi:MAG: DNRLRE domain-containing protein [Pirellulales bacterium]